MLELVIIGLQLVVGDQGFMHLIIHFMERLTLKPQFVVLRVKLDVELFECVVVRTQLNIEFYESFDFFI